MLSLCRNIGALRRISTDAFREGLKYLQKEQQIITSHINKDDKEPINELAASRHSIQGLIEVVQGEEAKPYRIPRLYEMDNNSQWCRALGPELARSLAKVYGVLGDVLPYETEAQMNVVFRFGNSCVSRFGNLITADRMSDAPCAEFRPIVADRTHSFMFLDADYPDEASASRRIYSLWSVLNLAPSEATIRLSPSSPSFHAYEPSHPARGSGTHRFIAVVIENSKPISLSQDRFLNLGELLSACEGKVVGYTFFRSCWTKPVSQIYSQVLRRPEPLYGELRAALPIRPYKYSNA